MAMIRKNSPNDNNPQTSMVRKAPIKSFPEYEYTEQERILQKQTRDQLCGQAFLMVNKGLLAYFTAVPALILANLIEKQRYFSDHNPRYGEWFFLSHEQQKKQLGITDWALVKIKKELVRNGVLHISRRGMPSREWYRIDYLVLARLLSLAPMDSGVVAPMDSGGHNNNISNKKENKYISPTSKKSEPNNDDDEYLPICERLSAIIQTKKNIKHTPSQITGWIKPIQKLIKHHLTGGNLSARKVRVKRALHWYAQHIGEPYIPVIESGYSLLEKFTKLEDAIEREKKQQLSGANKIRASIEGKYSKIKTTKIGEGNNG